MRSHLVIPDPQVAPDVPLDHMDWIGRYILDRKPDVIVHLGDHWNMGSLSSYDRGKIQMEGRRYRDDVVAGNKALTMLDRPTQKFNHGRLKRNQYHPRKVLLRGNHEERIQRAVEDNPQLEGHIGYHDLDTRDWEVREFLEPVEIDGVLYSHYFYNPMSGRPYGGQSIDTRLKTVGHSFTMGHQQGLLYGLRSTVGGMHHGLVAGSCYLHDEDYLGPQGNTPWRGIVVKHQVEDGSYDPMFVSLDFLCRKYEGMGVGEFLRQKYPDGEGTLWAA